MQNNISIAPQMPRRVMFGPSELWRDHDVVCIWHFFWVRVWRTEFYHSTAWLD